MYDNQHEVIALRQRVDDLEVMCVNLLALVVLTASGQTADEVFANPAHSSALDWVIRLRPHERPQYQE